MLSTKIISFLSELRLAIKLPEPIRVLNPYAEKDTQRIVHQFYNKFYKDNNSRYVIIGINPGRLGGGITGIPFTDPIRLEKDCGIINNWSKKQELSSLFMYDVIRTFGGPQAFYAQFYITSVSPLGFIQNQVNVNYYDNKFLKQSILPFAVSCLQQQLSWGLHTQTAFCLGEGENFKFLDQLNTKYKIFNKIIPLAHPRYILQYRSKQKESYIQHYLKAFSAVTNY